jgi:hypothetical protein
MIKSRWASVAAVTAGIWFSPGAQAACVVVGDSVGVGIGMALRGVCATSAKVGLSSEAVAERVRPGGHWTIASLGSNDFPRGIKPAQRVQSEARVRGALAQVSAKAGDNLLLVLPANGARSLVQGWAASNGVKTVSFTPGTDNIHPRSYATLAQQIRTRIGE